jgi:hypothetical protein
LVEIGHTPGCRLPQATSERLGTASPEAVAAFASQVLHLRKYVVLNYVCVVKATKKRNRHIKVHAARAWNLAAQVSELVAQPANACAPHRWSPVQRRCATAAHGHSFSLPTAAETAPRHCAACRLSAGIGWLRSEQWISSASSTSSSPPSWHPWPHRPRSSLSWVQCGAALCNAVPFSAVHCTEQHSTQTPQHRQQTMCAAPPLLTGAGSVCSGGRSALIPQLDSFARN